jgi:hypothetical protein
MVKFMGKGDFAAEKALKIALSSTFVVALALSLNDIRRHERPAIQSGNAGRVSAVAPPLSLLQSECTGPD